MTSRRLLVIAPDLDLLRSIAFALEAEGYVVTSHAAIPGNHGALGYDCVILDHAAASGPRAAVLSFCRESWPIVLLAGTAQHWLGPEVFRVLRTPLAVGMLSDAVRQALEARAFPVLTEAEQKL